jgi:drug/metabolite transporter (DMT)-like permease
MTAGSGERGPFAFMQRLGERHMVRYTLAYLAAGWVVLQVIGELGDNGILPPVVFRAAFALYLCALPGALIVSWFHGAKGRQDVPRLEKILLAVVGVFALSATGFVVRANLTPAGELARRVELPPEEDPTRVAVLYFERSSTS